jgi:pyruvate formate lyase activating enzyme
MDHVIYTATGCARCKILKKYLDEQGIPYTDFDFKGEGKDTFNKFYRENRADIYRDADGVEFPVYTDGKVIRQGVSNILGYLIAGDKLNDFIGRNSLHGAWLDGISVSSGDPTHLPALLKVMGYLKKSGLKIEVTTDGRNPAVLNQLIEDGLAGRIIMEVKGPASIYVEFTGQPIAEEDLKQSAALTVKAAEYQFVTPITPFNRADGSVGYQKPDEIGAAAQLIEDATGSKKQPYKLVRVAFDKEQFTDVEPLADADLFKYRTAARRYMVMTEIEK